jgi:hypothetical protein
MTIEQATRTLVKAAAFTGDFADYTETQLQVMWERLNGALCVADRTDEIDAALEKAALRTFWALDDFLLEGDDPEYDDAFEVDGEI